MQRLEPGIYSTSLINADNTESATVYHPLNKQRNSHQLTVDSSRKYNYRSRANSNIIERRFSHVEQPIIIPEFTRKYSTDSSQLENRFHLNGKNEREKETQKKNLQTYLISYFLSFSKHINDVKLLFFRICTFVDIVRVNMKDIKMKT